MIIKHANTIIGILKQINLFSHNSKSEIHEWTLISTNKKLRLCARDGFYHTYTKPENPKKQKRLRKYANECLLPFFFEDFFFPSTFFLAPFFCYFSLQNSQKMKRSTNEIENPQGRMSGVTERNRPTLFLELKETPKIMKV